MDFTTGQARKITTEGEFLYFGLSVKPWGDPTKRAV
jgi:hypothetical protein